MYQDDIEDYSLEEKKGFNLDIKTKITIGVVLLLTIVAGIILINKKDDNKIVYNEYEILELKLENEAALYLGKNNISVGKEVFIELSNLNIDLPSYCFKTSGVFIENDIYKPYLKCLDYKSNVTDNKFNYIKLLGNDIILLPLGFNYVEPGYEVKDYLEVKEEGEVGTEKGVYTLKYNVYSSTNLLETVERKVIVTDSNYVKEFYPEIELNGEEIEYLMVGEEYQEKGVTITDKIDNNLTTEIKGTVNTNEPGEYNLTYIVTNSRGYSTSLQKKVIINDEERITNIGYMIEPETLTSSFVKIKLNVDIDNYSYTILPDGSKDKSEEIEYTVLTNGPYLFIIYDNKGNYTEKIIEVSNIYKDKPTGKCNAHFNGALLDVSTENTSKIEVNEFKYIIDNYETEYMSSASFQYNVENVNNVKVRIKDIVGNEETIPCNIERETINVSKMIRISKYNLTYYVVNTRVNVVTFESKVKGRISQNAGSYGDLCLSFAYYHTCHLISGDMNLNVYNAAHYHPGCSFTDHQLSNKQEILGITYDELIKGKPVVMMVNGSHGRHFITVVGFKSTVKSRSTIAETDLLIIDSYSGSFSPMDSTLASKARYMYKQNGKYRVFTAK